MKKALVLGGGGAKGSYELGVWKALREIGVDFNMVIGTSIGSLNGCMYVQNDFKYAEKLWTNLTPDQVITDGVNLEFDFQAIIKDKDKYLALVKEALKSGSLDISPLQDLVRKTVNPSKIYKSKKEFYLTTVDVTTFKPLLVNVKELPEHLIAEFLLASSACFPALPLHEIEGKKYLDGGYYDNLPINSAIELGATEILAVNLDAPGVVRKMPTTNDMRITVLKAYWPLGNFLYFNGEQASKNIRLGYLDTLRCFKEYRGFIYTFKLKERMLKQLAKDFNTFLDEINNKKVNGLIPSIKFELSKKEEKTIDENDYDISDENKVLKLLEKFMELLEYSPYEIYEIDKVISELKLESKKFKPFDSKGWVEEFIKDPKSKLDNINLKGVILVLMDSADSKDTSMFALISQALKDECLLAILIYCLQKY